MIPDWELLEVSSQSRRIVRTGGLARRESTHEIYTRVLVSIGGLVGASYAAGHAAEVDLDDLVKEAVADLPDIDTEARDTPICAESDGSLASLPTLLDLQALDWLKPRAYTNSRLMVSAIKSGVRLVRTTRQESWVELAVAGFPVARLPADAPVAPIGRPVADDALWLIPPYVMSAMMIEWLLQGLCGGRDLAYWPHTTVTDPAWGGCVDLEGTRRRPTLFAANHRQYRRAIDLSAASRTGFPPTGHAGLAQPQIHDLVIGHETAPCNMGRGTIVVKADLLDCNPDGSVASIVLHLMDIDGSVHPTIVHLPHLLSLLDRGEWCGPWQRGIGPWTSRWFAIEEM